MIHLIEVNETNWRLPLSVAEHQKTFVADRTVMLARAYAYRNGRSAAYIIYNDDTPVGMALYYDCDKESAYNLSQLFIDEHYQGKGYGRAATELILNLFRKDGRYKKVILCYVEGNDAARRLYESFGFTEIDREEDEIVMELEL